MFVATTLAISLALSPVTTLGAAPRAYAWMGPASAAGADPCPKLEFRTSLQVDTRALSDDAQGIGNRLRGKVEQEIQRSDLMLGSDALLPAVVIKIVPLTGDDEGFTYTIDINHAEFKPIKDGSSVGECKLCTESELLEKIAGSTRALMPKLRAHITDYNNRPCPSAASTACESNAQCKDPDRPICHVREKRCVADLSPGCIVDADCVASPVGPLCNVELKRCVATLGAPVDLPPGGMNGKQKVGIGLMIAGALGAGVGVGLAVNKPKAIDPLRAWDTRETQKPGYALIVVGGAALVTGVVLFVLGRRQQQPRQARQARHQVTPMAGAGVYGLGWSGRF